MAVHVKVFGHTVYATIKFLGADVVAEVYQIGTIENRGLVVKSWYVAGCVAWVTIEVEMIKFIQKRDAIGDRQAVVADVARRAVCEQAK